LTERRNPQSLVDRVAQVGAIAAALGGVLAASVAGVLDAELVGFDSEHEVMLFAEALAVEVDEQLAGRESLGSAALAHDGEVRAQLDSLLAHELAEIPHVGRSAAIFRGGAAPVGDTSLPRLVPGECMVLDPFGAVRRACGVELGDGVLVLGYSAADERKRLGTLAWSLLVGGVIGALLGGLASRRAAGWALAPLTRLGDEVRAIDSSAPRFEATPGDPHEVEQLASALANLVGRLAATLAHAQNFAAQAAHELRTPLTALAGELELLAERSDADNRPAIEAVRRRVDELARLIQRLLVLADSSTIERGEAVDLADLVDLVLDALTSEARARVHAKVGEDMLVRGDAELLRAMLVNAIDNALKFSAGPVELDVSEHEGQLCVEVRDRGPGLAPDERERVFAPFVRADRTSKVAGHGLGLALIRHVATVHGGSAAFADAAQGARLVIRLPRWC
jgi:signal transduction histidine kinase